MSEFDKLPKYWQDAIDKIIFHKDEMRCNTCGEVFDMSDLNQVIEHEKCKPTKRIEDENRNK